MKVTRQLNIKDREGHFFSDIININDFDPGLLCVNRTVIDYDFTVYNVKHVKNLNKIDDLYIVFNDLCRRTTQKFSMKLLIKSNQ